MGFRVGEKVRIISGMFKGTVGVVVVDKTPCIGIDLGESYYGVGYNFGGLLKKNTGLMFHHSRVQTMEIVND